MTIKNYMQTVGLRAREASQIIAAADTALKNQALHAIAEALQSNHNALLAANAIDMQNGRANGLDDALLDRLELTPERISAMIDGLKQVAELPDPIGNITDLQDRPSGIKLGKMRVPLGVVGIIYE